MKIGLFGGTFDPIHLGHVDMIRQLCGKIALDKVIFVPANIPPHKHKPKMTSYYHRFAMTELAVAGDALFDVSDFESKSTRPSYTFYTIEHFKELYSQDEMFFILGVDSFNTIEEWHRWQELLCMTNYIVIDRPNKILSISSEVEAVLNKSFYKLYHLQLQTMPISSSMVRERLFRNESVNEYLPASVMKYIKDNCLYQ